MNDLPEFDRSDIDEIASALVATREWDTNNEIIVLDEKTSWRPPLIGPDNSVCHVFATNEISPAWIARMLAARQQGRAVFAAAPADCWRQSEYNLQAIAPADVKPILLERRENSWAHRSSYRSLSEMIATEGWLLTPTCRRLIGKVAFSEAQRAESAHEKGWRFEDFLCLLFSQSGFLRLHSHNYRSHVEEIDLVLEDRRTGEPPVVLVSAKNQSSSVGADAFRDLCSKMQERHRRCRLGFLCSAGKISSTVRELHDRRSTEDTLIVLINGEKCLELIGEDDLPEKLSRMIFDAALGAY